MPKSRSIPKARPKILLKKPKKSSKQVSPSSLSLPYEKQAKLLQEQNELLRSMFEELQCITSLLENLNMGLPRSSSNTPSHPIFDF